MALADLDFLYFWQNFSQLAEKIKSNPAKGIVLGVLTGCEEEFCHDVFVLDRIIEMLVLTTKQGNTFSTALEPTI